MAYNLVSVHHTVQTGNMIFEIRIYQKLVGLQRLRTKVTPGQLKLSKTSYNKQPPETANKQMANLT